MEQFSRECLEIDTESPSKDSSPNLFAGASMDKVYERAAKLVKRTLDVEGVIVLDVSHCEVLETMSSEGSVSVVMYHGDPHIEATTRSLSTEEYIKLNDFFINFPEGKISEGIVPATFRPFLPTHIQYALSQSYLIVSYSRSRRTDERNGFQAVPIFNVDKRPFALLCAYNASDLTRRFVRPSLPMLYCRCSRMFVYHQLEGHELSYLRAIGTVPFLTYLLS
jgi:hypothetical protein